MQDQDSEVTYQEAKALTEVITEVMSKLDRARIGENGFDYRCSQRQNLVIERARMRLYLAMEDIEEAKPITQEEH
jgi:hypothetical protein